MMNLTAYFIRTTLWPAIIFTIILMIAGCLGNVLILYIYRHHFLRSVPWMFIYALSILDLLACLIYMPNELVVLLTFTSFPSPIWCKISRYLSFIFSGSSCVILMAIALNRYEKVCRPNDQILNLKRAKYVCIGTVIFASVFFSPCLVIYGEFVFPLLITGDEVQILPYDFNMTQLESMNVTSYDVINGTFCTITQDSSPALVLVFYFFQVLLYVILVVLIIYFYSRVIRKMIHHSQKQQHMLSQMGCQASRADHIREVSNDNQVGAVKDEPAADLSQDFCKHEITVDLDKSGLEEKNHEKTSLKTKVSTPKETQPNDVNQLKISPRMIVKENGSLEKRFIKQSGSDKDLHLISNSNTSFGDPLETNQLLMRRIKSEDNLQIMPTIDPYEAVFEPLFLYAPKIHKKKNRESRKSKKSKSVKRSKSNVDVSRRTAKPTKRDQNARSLEGLAAMHCGNNNNNTNINIQEGTLTLTRRTTPKGTKNCIIPISTTLSMKSAVSYNALDPAGYHSNQNEKESNNKSKKILDHENDAVSDNIDIENKTDQDTVQSDDLQLQPKSDSPPVRRDTVSFRPAVTVIQSPNNKVDFQLRKRSESGSNPPRRNSENILTPSPKAQKVDYRRRQSVRPIKANRISRILFCISLAFVLSFLPFWIIAIVRALKGHNIMTEMSHVELGVLSVLIRFSLISNAINPMIYGLMNSQFRQRCRDIFRLC